MFPEHSLGMFWVFTVVLELPGLQIYLYSNQENIISGTALSCCTTNDINDLVVQLKNYFLLRLCVSGLTTT